MGRKSGGYEVYDRGGWAWISTRIAGKQVRESLGVEWGRTREAGDAGKARFEALIAGRVARPEGRIKTGHSVSELVALWLVVRELERPRSQRMHNDHARAFVKGFATTRELFADNARERYALTRAKTVLRKTVRKELSSLARFYEWAYREGHIVSVPPPYVLPLHVAGVRSGPQRAGRVDLSPREAAAFLRALPVRNRSGLRVRDFFILAWETGLRESTIARLSVPEHWNGGDELTITPDIDKSSFGRPLPITPRAVAALKRSALKVGPIFGDHDWRKQIEKAAQKSLPKEKWKVAARDFRHARLSDLADRAAPGDIPGIQHVAGHLQISTTSAYVHTRKDQARRVLSTRRVQKKSPRRRRP